MADTKELSQEMREEIACVEQGTLDWYKARLGNITSSNVHFVMKAGKATKSIRTPKCSLTPPRVISIR